MKKEKVLSLLNLLLVPGLLVLLGLILVVNPDAASVLIARILSWIFVLIAILSGAAAIVSSQGKIGKGLFAVAMAIIGGWLAANPLLLAAWIGRFVGVVILINSLPDLVYAAKQGRSILFHIFAVLAGVVLILLPMTTSRLVFSLCGIVVLAIGGLMFADRIRGRRWLEAGEDPNIIDAL